MRFAGAEIGSNLECDGGTFENPGSNAIVADRARVHGSVFLRDGFVAKTREEGIRDRIVSRSFVVTIEMPFLAQYDSTAFVTMPRTKGGTCSIRLLASGSQAMERIAFSP